MRAAVYHLDRSRTGWVALCKFSLEQLLPVHSELRLVEQRLADMKGGTGTKQQRRKLNREAWQLRQSVEYANEACSAECRASRGWVEPASMQEHGCERDAFSGDAITSQGRPTQKLD